LIVEPGVDGLGLVFEGKSYRLSPALRIAENTYYDAHLGAICSRAGLNKDRLEKVQDQLKMFRFRSRHIVETEPNGRVAELRRGVTLLRSVARNANDSTIIDSAIERLGKYILKRQMEDGGFSDVYRPSAGTFSDVEIRTWSHQAAGAWTMSRMAQWEDRELYGPAASKAIELLLEFHLPLGDADDTALIDTPDGRGLLKTSALVALAILDHPDRDKKWSAQLEQLLRGIRGLQDAGGRFRGTFRGFVEMSSQFGPGPSLALMAMMKAYVASPEEELLGAIRRGVKHYSELYIANNKTDWVPWFTQALCMAAEIAPDVNETNEHTFLAFLLTDRMMGRQLYKENTEYAELFGGVAAEHPGKAGADTALFIQGAAEAALTALVADIEEVHRMSRLNRYRPHILLGIRFLMQLQVRPEETFYMLMPEAAIGGIRRAMAHNDISIENCHQTLVALCIGRRALWPDLKPEISD
jgi:hypothetical protein